MLYKTIGILCLASGLAVAQQPGSAEIHAAGQTITIGNSAVQSAQAESEVSTPKDAQVVGAGEEHTPDAAPRNMALVTRAIYECLDGGRVVFVDGDSRDKYAQCRQLRAAHYDQVEQDKSTQRSPCSGAIIYQGGTYVFSDKEPCPIPEDVFRARQPIEAHPEYYEQLQPVSPQPVQQPSPQPSPAS